MDIRTFRAATLQEALEQVRDTLGPDAAVLHTRQVKRSRMGLFSSSLVEVEASVEMPVAGRFAKRGKANSRSIVTDPLEVQAEANATTIENVTASASVSMTQPDPNDTTSAVAVEIQPPDVTALQATAHEVDRAEPESRLPRETDSGSASRLPPAMYETLSEMLGRGRGTCRG